MSIESAKSFYIRVSSDAEFRVRLDRATTEERDRILQEAGYGFTTEEWDTAKE